MLDVNKLKRHTFNSNQITFSTKKSAPVEACINPYAPFKGLDEKNYLIGYDPRLNSCTNCYAFAMGWAVAANNKYDDYVPGFMVGQPYSLALAEQLVKADLEATGRKIYEVIHDIPKELPDGEGYWIKFLYCPEKGELDAHFMRKDKKSGRWIHKMGWAMPPKVCVRNLEFKSKKDIILGLEQMQGIPKELAESLLTSMIPKEIYSGIALTKSEIETDDSAGYLSFDESERTMKYETLWAMRISEP